MSNRRIRIFSNRCLMLTYKKVKYTLSLGEFSFYDPLQPTEILEDSKLSPFLVAKKR